MRCHQGMYGAHVPASQNKFSKIDWDAALESVGLSTYYTSDYLEPSDNAIEINNSSEKEVLHVRPLQEKQTTANHWGWNGVVWFRPDAAGDLSGGWPPNRTPVNGPWPSLGTGNRMLPQDRGLIEKDSVVDGAIAYIGYEKMQDMRFCTDNDNSVPMAYHVCLGDAALHPRTHYDPKTHQPCPGWTLTPQYADGTVNGCIPKSPRGLRRSLILMPVLTIVMVGVLPMAVVPVVVMVQGFIMVLPFIVVVLLAMLGAGMWRGLTLV